MMANDLQSAPSDNPTPRKYHRISILGLYKWLGTFFLLMMAGLCLVIGAISPEEGLLFRVIATLIGATGVAFAGFYFVALSQVRINDSGLEVRGFFRRYKRAWSEIQAVSGEKVSNGGFPPVMKVQVVTTTGEKTTFRLSYGGGIRFLGQLQLRHVKIISDLPQFRSGQ